MSRISISCSLGMILAFAIMLPAEIVSGKDYFLTIGGGYEPAGNQASLEANIIFYQEVIGHNDSLTIEHQIYFADGTDPEDDLQVLAPKTNADSPVIELLEGIFSSTDKQVTYRNHQVPHVTSDIRPAAIRSGLEQIASSVTGDDRLIIYVTAHGGSAKGNDPMNTSITCWGKESIKMREFSEWLDGVPSDVPVVMVMAQCYCGGFAHAMFTGGNPDNGLSKAIRVGFFAQRNDLPAAGCRPDIENDEEYSSYFWGAFVGRSRTGKPTGSIDTDQNGRVSFAEAHAYAVIASQTIDIPLRTSDTFLRTYSRIPGYEKNSVPDPAAEISNTDRELGLAGFSGSLENFTASASLDKQAIIVALSKQLDLSLDTEVSEVFHQGQIQEERFRQARRLTSQRGGSNRRGSRGSGRHDLQLQIIKNWPELEEANDWSDLPWLEGPKAQGFLDELRNLPAFDTYWTSYAERSRARERSTYAELKSVQFRRLIHTMESVLLAKNLPFIASPEILQRYSDMIALESSFLGL